MQILSKSESVIFKTLILSVILVYGFLLGNFSSLELCKLLLGGKLLFGYSSYLDVLELLYISAGLYSPSRFLILSSNFNI